MKKFRIHILFILMMVMILVGCAKEELSEDLAKVIEENIYRTSGTIKIGEAGFDNYFVLHDENNNRIPLLLHVNFETVEHTTDKNISSNLKSFKIDVIGGTEIVETIVFDDTTYVLAKALWINNDATEQKVPRALEGEVAYLHEKFPEQVEIKSVDEESIVYCIENELWSYGLSIIITKNPLDGNYYIQVQDEADVRCI